FARFTSGHYSCLNNISLSSTNSSRSVSLRHLSSCDCTGSCALTALSATAYTDSAEQSDEE
ncbi:hypothetical protein M9458_009777, partial [Cirrhinus mrigala]